MNTAVIERLEFAPPPQGGFGRAFGLALAAHLLLILALTWGLRWKNEPHDLAVQAELWSPSVQQASPKAAPRPPAPAVEHQPPPAPQPPPKPAPKPEPVVKPPPSQADAQAQRDADIALARKKQEEARKVEAAREQQKRDREAAEQERRELAQKKAADEKKRKEDEQRKLAEKKKAEEAEERRQAAAEAKKKAEAQKRAEAEAERKAEAAAQAQAKAKAAAQAKAADDARHKANVARSLAMAGGADSEGGSAAGKGKGGGKAGGQDERDAGPSGNYAGRIRAVVRPKIVFTDDVPGNPVAEVEVRTDESGLIISRRITRSSGVKSWDEAVLRALDRTERLPSDNGRYWNPLQIVFKLRD